MFCIAVFLLLLLKTLHLKISRKSPAVLERRSCRQAAGERRAHTLRVSARSEVSEEGGCHSLHTLRRETTGPAPQTVPLSPAAGREANPPPMPGSVL